jgi:hypothetical protein
MFISLSSSRTCIYFYYSTPQSPQKLSENIIYKFGYVAVSYYCMMAVKVDSSELSGFYTVSAGDVYFDLKEVWQFGDLPLYQMKSGKATLYCKSLQDHLKENYGRPTIHVSERENTCTLCMSVYFPVKH